MEKRKSEGEPWKTRGREGGREIGEEDERAACLTLSVPLSVPMPLR
jgi:hypothetical protein